MRKYPNNINIYVNEECNLRCIYCYEERKYFSAEIDKSDEFLHICNQIKKNNINKITLTGGEPLKCKYISKYIDMAYSMGFEIELLTNGTLFIPDDIIKKVSCITFSIDGADSIMRIHRGVRDTAVIRKNIDSCILNKCDLKINCVITKFNLNNFGEGLQGYLKIPGLVNFLKEIKIHAADIGNDKVELNDEEYEQLLDNVKLFVNNISCGGIVSINIIENQNLKQLCDDNRFMFPIWVKLDNCEFYVSIEKSFYKLADLLKDYLIINRSYLLKLIQDSDGKRYIMPSKGVMF